MVYYEITETKVVIEDETVCTYGIACKENDKITQCVLDVSSNKDFIIDTIKKFNDNQLAPEHFFDAVEDSLI